MTTTTVFLQNAPDSQVLVKFNFWMFEEVQSFINMPKNNLANMQLF